MGNKENTSTNIIKTDNISRNCCACDLPKIGDFKPVITLKKSGLTIFLHKNVEVQKTSKKSEDTYILHNLGEKELKRPDYISEMCQYKTKCMKCKSLVQRVRSLIDEVDDIKTDEVLGVCKYCKRSNTTSKCRRCDYIVSKYLSLKSNVSQNKQARFVSWLTKINELLRDISNVESVCKHRLYRHSHSVLELEQVFSGLKSPLSQRKPEITYFPTTAPERFISFRNLGQSKEMLEDILKRIKMEKSKHYTSEESLFLSSSRSSTGCVCKYFMSKKMEGRRSMEVLPQETYYPPGLITSREFAKTLTSDIRFRGSLDIERYGRRRSSSAEYFTKKHYTDYSKDGTSKERGRPSVLDKISSEYIYGRPQEFGHSSDEYVRERRSQRDGYGKEKAIKRDEFRSERDSRGPKRDGYGKERGSNRDEYGSDRRLKRDEYGKERGLRRDESRNARALKRDEYGSEKSSKKYDGRVGDSKKETPADAEDKLPGIKVEEDVYRDGKKERMESKSKREDISKKDKTKVDQIKDTKTIEGIVKKDVKLGDNIELISKDKTKTAKLKEKGREEIDTKFKKKGRDKMYQEEEIDKKGTKTRKETLNADDLKYNKKGKDKIYKEDDMTKKSAKAKTETTRKEGLKEDYKDKGKTDKVEDAVKKGTKVKKESSQEDDFIKEKKGKGGKEKEEKSSKKIKEDVFKTENDKYVSRIKRKEANVVIKDEEIRNRLKLKSKLKAKAQGDIDKESEEFVSDIEDVKTSKKTKGKKIKAKETKSTTEIPLKKNKASSEAVLLLKMMKELRLQREKEREAKQEKSRDFAALAPLPVIKRTLKPKLGPMVSESFIECDNLQSHEDKKIIIGTEIVHFDPTCKMDEGIDHKPLFFGIMQSLPDPLPYTEAPLPKPPPEQPLVPPESKKRPSSTKVKSKSKVQEEVVENLTGVLRYQLSNRKYIEEGCTVLPTTKILRKMNTYNMKLANPEFDFFKVNKKKKIMFYDTGEKLAEIYSNETGKWFYRNGNLALHCYKPKELNVRKRYVVYSSGDEKENGTFIPITILGLFDQLGNTIIYDYFGNVRLKYNQSEGVLVDEKIGPPGRWKWHTLNDPPILKPVFIDTYVQERDEDLDDIIRKEKETEPSGVVKDPNVDMIMIEFENFVREKAFKLLQQFKPFQIRMKAVKMNEYFSIRVLDQASVTLTFQDRHNLLKLHLGMNLINSEIVDTETSEVSEVATSYDRIPARTQSVSNIQEALNTAKKYGKSLRNKMQNRSTLNGL